MRKSIREWPDERIPNSSQPFLAENWPSPSSMNLEPKYGLDEQKTARVWNDNKLFQEMIT
jgi:hypothetical protein